MLINPLITSPSPRDILEFKQGQDTIPCDKLLVKYHHSKRAYKIMRSYFLEHGEYTHLILHPDDLIVNESHYNALKKTIEEHDYPVLSGVCIVSINVPQLLAVTESKLPTPYRRTRKYDFVNTRSSPRGIVKVLWSGFPFMWIRRDIVEKIEFEDDTRWNLQDPNKGWSFDVTFCYNCDKLEIPIYTDFDVMMKHLKDAGNMIKTGQTKPKVLLVKDNEEKDITQECHDKYLAKEDWIQYPHLNTTTHKLDMI